MALAEDNIGSLILDFPANPMWVQYTTISLEMCKISWYVLTNSHVLIFIIYTVTDVRDGRT